MEGWTVITISKKHHFILRNFDNDRVCGMISTDMLKLNGETIQIDHFFIFKYIFRNHNPKGLPIIYGFCTGVISNLKSWVVLDALIKVFDTPRFPGFFLQDSLTNNMSSYLNIEFACPVNVIKMVVCIDYVRYRWKITSF
jgi:hypothetical protein